MIDMQVLPVEFVSTALRMVKELDNIQIGLTDLEPSSQAARENEASIRWGVVDPTSDLLTIPGACVRLLLTAGAAREHLLSCISLLASNAERTPMNSIQALCRMSLEASSAALWLCSNRISWEERLRRHSQLRLRSADTSLKEGETGAIGAPTSAEVRQEIEEDRLECDTVMGFIHRRGWTCRKGRNAGKTPTIKQWLNELPNHSEMLMEAAEIASLPPEYMRALYKISSRSVHADPVIMASGSTDEDEASRLSLSMAATGTTLAFYGVAWQWIASWCSIPYPYETIASCQSQLDRFI